MTDVRFAWEALRRWWWLILVGTCVAGLAGHALANSITPVYRASATLLVNHAQGTAAMASYSDVLTSERLARTYGELMRTEPILHQVISSLGLPLSFQDLARRVDAEQVRDTQLIAVRVEHHDPQLAATIANTIASIFIARITEAQLGQTASTREVLARQVAEVEQQIKRTNDAIEQLRGSGEDRASSRLAALQSELGQYQTTYAQLLRNQHDMALEAAKAQNSISLAAPATAPDRPIRPDIAQRTLLALVVGLVASTALAMLIEHLTDAVRTPETVEQTTGLYTLGTLAALGGRRRTRGGTPTEQVLVAAQPHSVHGEAVRILRANLEFANVDRPCRTFLITSPSPGEGKSTIAANLAAALAQAGKRVLLVDADLRRPSLHKVLGVDNRQGLTTLLAQGGTALELVQATELPGFLMVLSSGPIPPNPAELLGSRRMEQLFEEFADMADVVVIDSPPVQAVADAVILSSRVDGVVLVVDANRTSRDALRRTHEALNRAGARMLGVVLNRMAPRSGQYQYYYGSSQAETTDQDGQRQGGVLAAGSPAAQASTALSR